MSQKEWLENLNKEKDDIEAVPTPQLSREERVAEFLQACRNKRDTMLEYHLFLNHMENLERKNVPPSEDDLNNMRLIADKVYSVNEEFFRLLDAVDGTEYWKSMRKLAEGLDEKESE